MSVLRDLASEDFEIVEPSAAAMIESMRAFGYTPQTALSDIIDNSITAGARNVWLDFFWDGRHSVATIRDDGAGMSEAVLQQAMRPGSQSPLAVRDPQDLGRFGLGLKTASFSQCRALTVASKVVGNSVAIRRWDLNVVAAADKWLLLKSASPTAATRLRVLDDASQGTLVLWEGLDRLVGDASASDQTAHDRFLKLIDALDQHLGMTFHRYLEGARPKLKIFVNGIADAHRVKPWDPFAESHPATYVTPVEPIATRTGLIKIQGFILPHRDRLSAEEHDALNGPAGWNAQQGFYVYRNERMLVSGGWLGLGRPKRWIQEEHYKLARIRVDLPNSTDHDWSIDLKKSTARPPPEVRERLRTLAEAVRKQAREVFIHRGQYSPRAPIKPVDRAWVSDTRRGRTVYRVDRKHPLVAAALAASPPLAATIEAMLRVVEESVPVQRIWLDHAEQGVHARPFEGEPDEAIVRVMAEVYRALREGMKLSPQAAKRRLALTEPFGEYPLLIEKLET